MQIHRTVDETAGIAYSTITGEISLGAVQAEMKRVMSDPVHNPQLPALVDVRQATSCMTTEEILILAETIRKRPRSADGVRHALLVNTALMRGLYRMFHAFVDGGPVHYQMFECEDEARQWLAEQ